MQLIDMKQFFYYCFFAAPQMTICTDLLKGMQPELHLGLVFISGASVTRELHLSTLFLTQILIQGRLSVRKECFFQMGIVGFTYVSA